MKYLLALVAILTPLLTFAHAGHGATPADHYLHYLTTPEHAIPSLSVGILLGILWYRKRTTRHA